MRVALIHDYLTVYGGGERVLEIFHEIFPDAPIYTLFYERSKMPERFLKYDIRTSFIDKLPFKNKFWKLYIPFMPLGIESFDFSDYDMVISICSSFSKGILTGINTCHISYVLTVPRFLWGYETSTQQKHKKNIFLPIINEYLRIWDRAAADRVDYFIANSNAVKKRIYKSYSKNSNVIYSPVDENKYSLSNIKREDYYLIVSRLEKYKHVDLAIKTCIKNGLNLKIIGSGSEMNYLQGIAKDKVDFLGEVDDETVLRHLKSAKAVIFPGADDLGLVPIEAQMCGTPVIAFKKDGALETIMENKSGIFFDKLSEDSLYAAIRQLDNINFIPSDIRSNVLKFSKAEIKKQMEEYILLCLENYKKIYNL